MSTILEKNDAHTRRLMQGELEGREYPCGSISVKEGTFAWALAQVGRGMAIHRTGWNGEGQFVYMVPAASYPAQTGVAKAHFGEGSLVPYAAYLALKNAQGSVSVWVPSTGDLFATDWAVHSFSN